MPQHKKITVCLGGSRPASLPTIATSAAPSQKSAACRRQQSATAQSPNSLPASASDYLQVHAMYAMSTATNSGHQLGPRWNACTPLPTSPCSSSPLWAAPRRDHALPQRGLRRVQAWASSSASLHCWRAAWAAERLLKYTSHLQRIGWTLLQPIEGMAAGAAHQMGFAAAAMAAPAGRGRGAPAAIQAAPHRPAVDCCCHTRCTLRGLQCGYCWQRTIWILQAS